MTYLKFTPSIIVENDLYFSIPIYQRLFEWTDENVSQLLNDLYKAHNTNSDYYIGMLTSNTEDGETQLVDGQQRFTVMMLMGSVMQKYSLQWHDFLLHNNQPRLHLASRNDDEQYLQLLIAQKFDNTDYVNLKMQKAAQTIAEFMDNLEENSSIDFADYVCNHLSFFITKLPNGYNAYDLNKHFERMNCSGKNLEQHEILKVKLISQLGTNVPLYMQLWNKLSDVDTPLIRKRTYWNENEASLGNRKNMAMNLSLETLPQQLDVLNGLREESLEEAETIENIKPSPNKPRSEMHIGNSSRCVLRFPYLLLQTLYYYLGQQLQDGDTIQDFFNPNNLLTTFQKYLPYEGNDVSAEHLHAFLNLLLKCRIRLDLSFIRTLEYGYSLDMNAEEGDDNLRELLMYESFLYVSSSNYTNYRWFGWLMEYMLPLTQIPAPQDLFHFLIDKCDKANPLPPIEDLHFGEEIRYWFWRLDFCLWQKRNKLFCNPEDEKYLRVINNYVFTRSRSIEHIAPQQPKTESILKWDENDDEDIKLRNSFGNLCMISQSLNSSLSNSSYQEKRAHVESYFSSVTGTIESLKLLMVYRDYNDWDKLYISDHGEKMYGLLKENLSKESC